MKKRKMIIFGCLFLLGVVIGLTACLLSDDSSKQLELTYSTKGGVPYEWKYEIKDNSIVKLVKKYTVDKEKGIIEGGNIDINYVFKGLKEGKTTIIFKYVSLDGEVVKEEKQTVKVDKNKNISLVVVD